MSRDIAAELAAAYAERVRLIQRQTRVLTAAEALSVKLDANAEKIARLEAGLHAGTRSVNVQDVTKAQKSRRGRAVAKSRAAGTKDPRRVAIAARWGSLRQAAKAAGISPAALVGYLDGAYPCPRRVAKAFAVDPALPATRETWPKDVVD